MTWPDDRVDRVVLVFSAYRSVVAHDANRRCYLDCPGEGCRQYAWALETLTAHGGKDQDDQTANR
ncbi:hypothetical protein [Micromonospora endophytica]|uniref:Uncharacterized protein n=1 Tax=Micromonospora endophytica TaxID=515350 RepID=A0A2W2BUL0_9ACTN|nr:hypothetical protein [Micromonospora endophytica]PZF89812.1 hypothetical protein C1I93_23495 [Micromonospora endophytica]RIW45216.1 hypothetical protein D3H59_15630 [Micromonospora endophytica]BCJ59568.1 hypothetical protein Jiend_29900 [Micromonospora endophytica]